MSFTLDYLIEVNKNSILKEFLETFGIYTS